MKILKIIKDDLIEDYRKYKAVNYSLLKEIANENYNVIRDGLPEHYSTAMDFGSFVDKTIETGVKPEKNLHIYNHKELTGHSKLLVDHIIQNKIKDAFNNINKRLEIANELKLWSNTKSEDLRLELVNSNNIVQELIKESKRTEGYDIISQDDYILANKFLHVLETHKFSKNIIKPPLKIENLKQVGIRFMFNGVECKILLDLLQINYKEKWIKPIDLKTGTFKNFKKNYIKYKYPIQGTLYTLALYYLINKYPELKGFTVKPFTFLYLSRERPSIPLKYTMSNKSIEKYTEGYINKYGDYTKGIIDYLNDYKFHVDKGIFDISREEYENDGVIMLPEPF